MKLAKKFFSMLLVVCFIMSISISVSAAGADTKTPLKFTAGKFKIMMINDTQDTDLTKPRMLNFLKKSLDEVNPDLVVLVGDNIADNFLLANAEKVEKAIRNVIDPIAERNIPFAVVFGNHDEECGVSKEEQMAVYTSYSNCYAIDEGDAISGVGTYNIPIMSSDGKKTAFNVYMMDSQSYDENGDYDGVHDDQIAWYEKTSNELKAANGGKPVPSLLFQHIPVSEIYSLLKEVPFNTAGAVRKGTKWYLLDETKAEGYMLEAPCATVRYTGQYDSWLKQGDIAGAFFGHDHVNNFVGTTDDGIVMGHNTGMGFRAYGKGGDRSVRVFEIDESAPEDYNTYCRTYNELMGTDRSFFISDILALRWLDVIIVMIYNVAVETARVFGKIIKDYL